jgi:hypothetical protein
VVEVKKEEPKEEKKVEIKAFDASKGGKSWGEFDLNAMVKQNNLPEAKKIIIKEIVSVSANPRLKDSVQLKLTEQT